MTTAAKLTRRRLLSALGPTAAALPLLQSTRAAAVEPAFPKRVLFVFSPNGTIYNEWQPTGTVSDFQFKRILKPLEDHKKDLLILDNVKNEAAHHGPGDGHMQGMGTFLTATELLMGTQFKCGGTDPCSGWGGGISIDQYIAEKLNLSTKFKTLELAVRAGGASIWSRMAYAAADRPIAPNEDPTAVYTRVFGDFQIDTAGLQRSKNERKSVLAFVNKRMKALQPKLPAEDRLKIDAHLEALRDVERRIDVGGASNGCVKPDAVVKYDAAANDNFPKTLKLQTDLLVRSFACDMTRVATLQWSRSVGGERFKWLGIGDRDHHDLSHDGDSAADSQDKLTKINTWYAEQFAYLLAQMKLVKEGAGTMLDNTVIVWGNELGKGNAHSRTKIPIVLAGSCGGYFKTGRWLQYKDDSHSNLLVSVANAMGVQTQTFGNPAYCQGPLRMLQG